MIRIEIGRGGMVGWLRKSSAMRKSLGIGRILAAGLPVDHGFAKVIAAPRRILEETAYFNRSPQD